MYTESQEVETFGTKGLLMSLLTIIYHFTPKFTLLDSLFAQFLRNDPKFVTATFRSNVVLLAGVEKQRSK